MATRKIVKRKLTDVTFEHQGAHVALVSKQQEGPANGHAYTLVMKSNFSKEAIQKMQQVRVTLELPEFLEKFFHIYGSDACILAQMMGYVKPEEEEEKYSEDWYENRIKERLASYEILKSMRDAEDFTQVLSALSEEEYVSLLQDQEAIEKALKFEPTTEVITETEVKPEIKKSKVKPSKSPNTVKGKTQMDEVVELQKSLDASKLELQKALDDLNQLKAEKLELAKAKRFELLKAAVKDEAKATVLFKSLNLVTDEAEYTAAVAVLAEMQTLVEKSALFEEQGAQVETEAAPVQESAIAKLIKSQLAKAAAGK